MSLIDRFLFASFMRSLMICLISLLSLYIVVDLFTNMDDFAKETSSFSVVMSRILSYYGYRILGIFDRLCEAIILLAAMFTVSWLQRNNELIPIISAGVSTRRILRPIFVGTVVVLTLGILNQELVIPKIGDQLLLDRGDALGQQYHDVEGGFDRNGVHIEGIRGHRKQIPDPNNPGQKIDEMYVDFFYCTIPDSVASGLIHLSVTRAYYIPPNPAQPVHTGGWLLLQAHPPKIDHWCDPRVLDCMDPGRYFLYVQDLDYAMVTRSRNWFVYSSTESLRQLLDRGDTYRMSPIAVLFHMRLTRPILGVILVILGVSMILRDQNRHVFISAGLCLAMCAIFFATVLTCKQLGDTEIVSPALAAWLPVLIFGPISFSLFDAIHT